MTETEERRAQGAKRVHLSTLVEICGNEPGIPAFEAEALDVSGRGMHMRTAYLPELGAPLVCRFEDGGREILVEGVVAWRREGGRGGEFGLQFTALDSGSVDALTELCGAAQAAAESAQCAPGDAGNDAGARVRLHIEGLGSPMKARVRNGGERQIQVGSNLEFLKVGRRLEIEDVEGGDKRNARIEGVSVAIDPQTRIPQLVVVLRYDDAPETTPEPSVIDAHVISSVAPPAQAMDAPSAAYSRSEQSRPEAARRREPVPASHEELDDEDEQLRGKLGHLATRAGAAMQQTTSRLMQLGADAGAGLTRLVRDARALRSREHAHEDKPRRTTHIPPAPSADGRRLRPQSGARPEDAAVHTALPLKRRRIKQLASAGAAIGLLATVSVIAMQGGAPPPGAEPARAPAAAAVESPAEPAAALANKAPAAAKNAPGNGISADVPLFGPTPMATMEPAPLGPAPEAVALAVEPRQAADAPSAGAAEVGRDETFADEPVRERRANPSEVEPWGRGRMRTPTVHRLRLDAPGAALQGAITPTGFAVVVPERKFMESALGIKERDKRIARVQTKNLGSGAQITFQFRNGVPGYRVRLRKDYVEFLISAEEKSATQASESASGGTRKSSKGKEAARADSKKESTSRSRRNDD
ncbi:MAG TPA: PilZ domain-containing protein [Polyangiaceae bacterium]